MTDREDELAPTTLDRMAAAMEARRQELIARPLRHIYRDLAVAALEAVREPDRRLTERVYDTYDISIGDVEIAWEEMIDHILGDEG